MRRDSLQSILIATVAMGCPALAVVVTGCTVSTTSKSAGAAPVSRATTVPGPGAVFVGQVRFVPTTQLGALAGCAFVRVADESIACPADHPAGRACTAYRATQTGGNAVLEGSPARIYRCPVNFFVPETKPTVSEMQITVTASEDDLRGCTHVDRIDTTVPCPTEYPEGVSCMAYRARRQGGDIVLAQGDGEVYDCTRSAAPPK